MTNPYQVLGIPNNSSVSETKAAFRRLASLHHPDAGGDPEKFIAVKTAFDSIKSGYRVNPPRSSSTYPGTRYHSSYDGAHWMESSIIQAVDDLLETVRRGHVYQANFNQ